MNFVIASASPRRKELFALCGWEADVCPTSVPEERKEGEDPITYVTRLAGDKVMRAVELLGKEGPAVVIAADTIVVYEGKILEKPVDQEDAYAMLEMLRGKIHQVHTAVSVVEVTRGLRSDCLCTTDVPMREYTDREVSEYVAGGSPMDKAGGYGIQDRTFSPVQMESMRGCYANVMGLPLCHLIVQLRGFSIHPVEDVPAACQYHNQYQCPVHAGILGGEACVEPR